MDRVLLNTYAACLAAAGILLPILLCALIYSRISLKKLQRSAYMDPATSALTEVGFEVKGQALISNRNQAFAFVSMQVVELPHISKTYGLTEYRELLQYLCGVLKTQLGGDELIARTGEDTFCFLIQNRRANEICAKLDNICDAFNRFNDGQLHAYSLKPMFGIYLPESATEDIKDMKQKAAMARMSIPADERYGFYNRETDHQIAQKQELAVSVSRALQAGEFIVYFQPKVRVSDQRIVGAEALIRWRHAQRGLLSPDMFLQTAEQYHLIGQIDLFVFEEVCRTLARWQEQHRELCPISINLSGPTMNKPGLADECYELCRKYDVPPAQIEFEIKEATLRANLDKAGPLVERLHFYGFRCAIDNFGSDLCSLQILGTLDMDTIKLDGSFFSGGNNNRHGRHMVETILKLAAQMQVQTVAEGIDNHGQVQYLQQAACDIIQGFYFFKPMPIEKFESEAYEEGTLKYAVIDSAAAEERRKNQSTGRQHTQNTTKSIVLFSYRPQEDEVKFSDVFSPVLDSSSSFKDALALFRTTDLIHENDRKDFLRLLERCQHEDGWVENTLRFYMSHGKYEWLEVRAHQDDHNGGVVSGMLADMSGWKNEVNRWKEKATRDPLTGLFNREHFEQAASTLLQRKEHSSAALVFVDVDDFKKVNDTFGHMFGDDVLCFVAKQILGIFRHTDIVARYGGDEFVVFAPAIQRPVLEDRLKKLLSTFQHPYRSGTVEHKISVTIGGSLYPDDGTDYSTLLDHADCALYEAKERGKKQYVLYEPHMQGETAQNSGPDVSDL